jgi:hypothetical protein
MRTPTPRQTQAGRQAGSRGSLGLKEGRGGKKRKENYKKRNWKVKKTRKRKRNTVSAPRKRKDRPTPAPPSPVAFTFLFPFFFLSFSPFGLERAPAWRILRRVLRRLVGRMASSTHHHHNKVSLGAVYTMDHEVVPRKRPILRGTISWDDFRGPSY